MIYGFVVLMVLVVSKSLLTQPPKTDPKNITRAGNHSFVPGAGRPANMTSEEYAKSKVALDFQCGKEGLGHVMLCRFTIDNQSNYVIKDIEIFCQNFAKSGTALDTNSRTIYDNVPAHSKKTIEKFNMGFIHDQTDRTGCKVSDLKIN